MATTTRRRRRRFTRRPVRSRGRAAPARRRATPSRRRAPATQTIRIVVEQPQPQMQHVPTMLPDQVGLVVATAPRRARF